MKTLSLLVGTVGVLSACAPAATHADLRSYHGVGIFTATMRQAPYQLQLDLNRRPPSGTLINARAKTRYELVNVELTRKGELSASLRQGNRVRGLLFGVLTQHLFKGSAFSPDKTDLTLRRAP